MQFKLFRTSLKSLTHRYIENATQSFTNVNSYVTFSKSLDLRILLKPSILVLVVLFASCKKKNTTEETPAPATLSGGILVLNEGLFNLNNASLMWLNTSDGTNIPNFFEQKTNRGLGDTGNDMKRYGNKIYIIVNVSSTVEVLNATTGNPITQINMVAGSTPKQPRFIEFKGSKAFITCYDGYVDVLDTASLTITNRIQVGANPEHMAISNNRLFVCNSGGLNFPDVDSTVSVIDLGTLTEIQKITCGPNMGDIAVDPSGEIYAISRGDYGSIPSRMHRINPITLVKEETFPFDASSITEYDNQFIIVNSVVSAVHTPLFNPATETISGTDFFDLSGVETVFGIQYRASNNKFYICDAMDYTVNGKVHIFNTNGQLEQTFSVGLNPNSLLFYD